MASFLGLGDGRWDADAVAKVVDAQ
jgi:hypothetical protein